MRYCNLAYKRITNAKFILSTKRVQAIRGNSRTLRQCNQKQCMYVLVVVCRNFSMLLLILCFPVSCFLDRNVRLKVWEGLPPGNDEKPPVEVKNILTPVFFQSEDGIKAWICYPSTSFLKGEIMTPNSQYDCRIKLRAGMLFSIKHSQI